MTAPFWCDSLQTASGYLPAGNREQCRMPTGGRNNKRPARHVNASPAVPMSLRADKSPANESLSVPAVAANQQRAEAE